MLTEYAESVYKEMRLALTKIQKGGLEAQKLMEKLADKFKLQGINTVKDFTVSVNKALDVVEKSSDKFGKSIGKKFTDQMGLLRNGKNMIKDALGAVKDFFKSDEGFIERIKTLKSSLEKSLSTPTPEADSFMDIIEKTKTNTQQVITEGKEFASGLKSAFDDVVSSKDELKNIIPDLSEIQLDNINISDETKENILGKFNEITKGIEEAKKGVEGESDNWFANFLGFDEETLNDTIMKAEKIAGDVLSKISDLIRNHAEEQMSIIDKALGSTLSSIEEARKAELIAAGFAIESNNENLEAQLEAAKKTGDEVLIYQLERRMEEQRINEEYDAMAQAAEETAAQEKAKIQYEVAKQEHAIKLINAITEGAMAVMKALSSAPPPFNFVLAGASGAAAAVQIGMIANNPPKMPHFANSGIVPGNKFFGDRNIAAVDSGELILNRAHQDNIAAQLTEGGIVTATIVVLLDGKELGQTTFDLANKGHYTLKTRAIQG